MTDPPAPAASSAKRARRGGATRQRVHLVPTRAIQRKVLVAAASLGALLVLAISLTAMVTTLPVASALWFGGLSIAVGVLRYLPVRTGPFAARPQPAADYAGAVSRFERERAATKTPLNPLCEPVLLSHGARTQVAVVLLHGVSSCPHAFVDLAPLLHGKGHNVLAARMPENGYADRETDALNDLTAEKLRAFGDCCVDIAAGLGERVVVLGMSAGGTVAAWVGQNRPEVDRVVLIAPFFGLATFGPGLNIILMRLMLAIPPLSVWKDPDLKADYEGMPHAYKRQSTRGTGEIMRLGLATAHQARGTAPCARDAAIITNAADRAVDNRITDTFAAVWREQGLPVSAVRFEASHGLGHELIDPLEPGADPALTYPVIVAAIEADPDGRPTAGEVRTV